MDKRLNGKSMEMLLETIPDMSSEELQQSKKFLMEGMRGLYNSNDRQTFDLASTCMKVIDDAINCKNRINTQKGEAVQYKVRIKAENEISNVWKSTGKEIESLSQDSGPYGDISQIKNKITQRINSSSYFLETLEDESTPTILDNHSHGGDNEYWKQFENEEKDKDWTNLADKRINRLNTTENSDGRGRFLNNDKETIVMFNGNKGKNNKRKRSNIKIQ